MLFQATGSNGQTSDKLFFTIYVIVSSTSQQINIQTSAVSTNDVIIIVLAVVVVVLFTFIIVNAVYRIRIHETKTEDNETSYEEVNRNNVTDENIFTIIEN